MYVLSLLPALILSIAVASCAADSGPEPTPGSITWVQTQDGNTWWLNVWSAAADDRWVVGGTKSQGAILHDDGSGWKTVDPGIDIPLLNWTHGFARNDLVMVGNEGTILTYDGSVFAKEPSPSVENLWGVWGASKDRVYAVGGSGRPDSNATLLLRSEGTWSEIAYPTLQRPNVHAFFKVWGSGDSDVYVVGQKGAVLHWNGADWSELSVFPAGQDGRDLISVWGSGPDRVAIVGGRNNGVLILKNGEGRDGSWRTIDLAFDSYPGLNGVWMRNNKVHAVGNSGQILRFDYDSGAVEQDVLLDTMLDLHAINGSPDGLLTAVSFNPIATQETDAAGEIYSRGTTDDD